MKIVHVTEDFSAANTGITSAVRELARAGISAGHAVEVVTVGAAPDLDVPGLKIHAVASMGVGASWRYAPDFAQALETAVANRSVVHIHGLWMYPQRCAARLALERRWPLVVSPHNMLGGWLWRRGSLRRAKKRLYLELLLRHLVSHADAIHTLSEVERSAVADFFPESRTVKIPQGLDLATLDAEIAKSQPVGVDRERYVLFLGRLHPVKGIDLLIDSIANLRDRQPVKLVIAGPPSTRSYERQLKEQVRSLGLEAFISFIGPVYGATKWRLISAAWVLCAPSHSEGMSMAALEAMAAGLPVITTAEAGFDDLKHAGGIVVDTKPTAIAIALENALAWTPAQRTDRSVRARAAVEENYSWTQIWPRYESLYESLFYPSASK